MSQQSNVVDLSAFRAAKTAKTAKKVAPRKPRSRRVGFALPIGRTMPLAMSIRRDAVREQAAARI